MRFDKENQLSVVQTFTATGVSTNSYQKQSAAQDLSIGRRMAMLVLPTITDTGGAAYTLQAIQADDAALTTNVEVLASVPVAAGLLAKGSQFEVPIPQGSMTRTFLGFKLVVTGGSTPSVTLDVYFVPQDEDVYYKPFPKVVGSGA